MVSVLKEDFLELRFEVLLPVTVPPAKALICVVGGPAPDDADVEFVHEGGHFLVDAFLQLADVGLVA